MSFCLPSILYIFISIVIYYITYKFEFSWKIKRFALIPLFYSAFLYYVYTKSKIVAWLLIPVPFIILTKMALNFFQDK
jgi:hypothetical protein